MTRQILTCALIAFAMSALAFAAADGGADAAGLQEVIVTAQRREENLQLVPISVTAFTGEMLERGNITSVQDYLSLTPNASFSEDANFGHTGVNLSLRGVSDLKTGQNSVVNSIGIYLDGFSVVSLPTGTFNPRLGDMQSVEVLRGPQGTYFGRNSLGGALNLTTRNPTSDFGGQAIASVEDFSTRGTQTDGTIIVNLPITSTLAARGVFHYEHSSGLVENVNPDGVGTGHRDVSGRLTALWTPTDNTTAKFTVIRSSENQAGDETVPSGVWNVDTVTGYQLGVSSLTQAVNECGVGFWPQNQSRACRDGNEYSKENTTVAILNVAEKLSSDVVVKWISGVVHESGARFYDGDAVGKFDNFNNFEQRHGTSYSTELRAEITKPGYVLVFGGLYADDKQALHNDVLAGTQTDAAIDGVVLLPFIPANFCFSCTDRHFDLKSASAFADLTYYATPKLALIAGGRVTRDKVTTTLTNEGLIYPDLSPTGVAQGTPSFTDFSPRVGVRYAADDDLDFYATISKGYKAGGTSVGFNANPALVPLPAIIQQPFRAETLWNYEVGMKSEWLDRRLRVNASVFYLDWRNLQLEAYRFLVPGNLQSKFALTANIDRAKGDGAELEVTGRVTSKFTLSAALGYLDTKIQESPLIELSGGYLANLVGLPVPKSPPFTASVAADYRWTLASGELSTRAEFVHRDGQYSDIEALTWKQSRGTSPPDCAPGCFLPATPNGFPFHTPSYNLVNLRASYDLTRFSAEVYVDNLFDETYFTGTAENYGLSGIHLRPHPRVLGLQVGYKFGNE